MAADCKSAAPCELRRFESSPVHQLFERTLSNKRFRVNGIRVNRLAIALAAYAVLVVLTWSTIPDEKIRLVTLGILALFAVKTVVRRKDVMRPGDDGEE